MVANGLRLSFHTFPDGCLLFAPWNSGTSPSSITNLRHEGKRWSPATGGCKRSSGSEYIYNRTKPVTGGRSRRFIHIPLASLRAGQDHNCGKKMMPAGTWNLARLMNWISALTRLQAAFINPALPLFSFSSVCGRRHQNKRFTMRQTGKWVSSSPNVSIWYGTAFNIALWSMWVNSPKRVHRNPVVCLCLWINHLPSQSSPLEACASVATKRSNSDTIKV